MELANKRPHRPGRFLSLPWCPWEEAFEDHDEVAMADRVSVASHTYNSPLRIARTIGHLSTWPFGGPRTADRTHFRTSKC
jgi:hypothetical protein